MLMIGDRVEVGGDRGTISYIGAVEGYDEEWIGIDWDNPERGKHDGCVKGKRYFQASSAKSGSFVRSNAINTGKNLLEEVSNRYNGYMQYDTIEFGSKNVNLVNMAKIYEQQNNLWKLRIIVLDNMKVAKAPPASCEPFMYCTELNLYNNLLSQWCDLLDILCFFPSLRLLIASHNYMEKEMKSVINERIVSAPISTLALGECRIDESTAQKIMHVFLHVREIHLDRNNLKFFDPGECGHSLESIDLDGNPINDFTNLHVLSTLPNLQKLSLVNCGLRRIEIPDDLTFSSLSSLNIKDNPIKDKQWIMELAKFPKLERLCYSSSDYDNADSGIDLREIVIASIPQLKFLGNSEISSIERQSAEMRFLNRFFASPVTEENRAIVKRLIKIYGEPSNIPLLTCDGIGLLKLKLSYEGKVMERSIPESATVQKLIGIVSRLFHLDARKISLQAYACNGFAMNLDKPLRTLDFYSLSSGDTIYATLVFGHRYVCFMMDENSTNRRKIFVFVLEAGIKLEAKNSTICTAAILTYRTLRKSGASEFCPYMIASACILLAAKTEEDELIKTRDVVNVAYSILHPREPMLQIDDESWALRTSLSRMEYIVLRFLKFRLAVENPHKYLLHYISSLMHWYPHEFTKFHIGTIAFVILRDAHVDPDWILSHNPQTIAIVCLAVALRVAKVSIDIRWYSVFYWSMTKSKLRRLEEELVTLVLRR